MAESTVQESKFDSDELDYKDTETQQRMKATSSVPAPVTTKDNQKKKKIQFRYLDLVGFLSLILAALALLLVFIQLSNSLNQSYSNSDQQTTNQPDFQILQAQMGNLKSIQTQVNNSLTSFHTQINNYKEEILAKTRHQQDVFERDFQMLQIFTDQISREINILQIQQGNLSYGLEIQKKEYLKTKENLSNTIDIELSNLQGNVSTNTDRLYMLRNDVLSINNTLQTDIGTFVRPASSCKDISEGSPSDYYWIQTNSLSSPVQVYCDMNRSSCTSCTTTSGWTRIADLDMTNPSQQCPRDFQLITRSASPRRTCGRPDGTTGCVSVTFPVYGVEYSRVCGRIVGYQIGSPSGFETGSSSIDSHYMAGISLTHGQPRQHIWSFVNAKSEAHTSESCPCIQGTGTRPPLFVGNDYFCDSALSLTSITDGVFYPNDPLWDGQGCGSGSTCCTFNTPPWFCKQLSRPTTDDIELRLCENSQPDNDDTPFDIVELYIN